MPERAKIKRRLCSQTKGAFRQERRRSIVKGREIKKGSQASKNSSRPKKITKIKTEPKKILLVFLNFKTNKIKRTKIENPARKLKKEKSALETFNSSGKFLRIFCEFKIPKI